MDRRLEVAASPCCARAAGEADGREDALRLLAELGDVQGRLDDLKRRLRELAEEAEPAGAATPTPSNRGAGTYASGSR